MNTGKVLLGLIAGFAAGASLGIILAPAKGSETRKFFTRKHGEEENDPLIEKFIEFLSGVSENHENVDKIAEELITKVKSTLRHLPKDKRIMETESGSYKI